MKLSKLFGITSARTVRWVKHYMPDFYERECYKKPSTADIDVDLVVSLYNKLCNMSLVATELGVDRTIVATLLHRVGIKTSKQVTLSVDMLLADDATFVKTFPSIKEAALYCIDVLNCKTSSNNPIKLVSRSIRDCIFGRQKTAYGFKWREHIKDKS